MRRIVRLLITRWLIKQLLLLAETHFVANLTRGIRQTLELSHYSCLMAPFPHLPTVYTKNAFFLV